MKKTFIYTLLCLALTASLFAFTGCDSEPAEAPVPTSPPWPSAAFESMADVPMFNSVADSVTVDPEGKIAYISFKEATYTQAKEYINTLIDSGFATSDASLDINMTEEQLPDGLYVWTSVVEEDKPSVEVYYYDLDVAKKSNGDPYRYSLIIKISDKA